MYHKTSKSGDVYQALRYRQRKYSKAENHRESADSDVINDDVDELSSFFKNIQLPKDEQKLKKKLQESVDLRSVILSQHDDSYPEMFEFYLIDPNLVWLITFETIAMFC